MSPIRPGATPSSIRSADGAIGLEDFYAVPSMARYMYMPTRESWIGRSVDRILPAIATPRKLNGKFVTIKPSLWLDQNRRVEQISWLPGAPEIIEDRLITSRGWLPRPGARCLNLYRPPASIIGDPALAGPWLDHLERIYPTDHDHIADWLAQRVQQPAVKPNHVLLLGGPSGIGKDWVLFPLGPALGDENFRDISPEKLFERFNAYGQAVVLLISEAHDLGDGEHANRFKLYERLKIYAASPPDVLRIDEKFVPAYYVPNIVGVAITTNYKSDGIYLPSDDRRFYIAWSESLKEEFAGEFEEKWRWMTQEGGAAHVAAYLAQRDLSKFNPRALPQKTSAFFDIVDAGQAPEDAELADALDQLGRPDICSLATVAATPIGAGLDWLLERKSRRSVLHRMERCGYARFRNPEVKNGLWVINGRRQALYARAELDPKTRLEKAKAFADQMQSTRQAAAE
jgi:hypothetical protein